MILITKTCVCVFSSHSFWTSSSLDVPARVTQEEGHTSFLIHLLSAMRALIFLARGGVPCKDTTSHYYKGIAVPVGSSTTTINNNPSAVTGTALSCHLFDVLYPQNSTSTSTRDREGRTLLAIKNLRHVPQWKGCVAFLLL